MLKVFIALVMLTASMGASASEYRAYSQFGANDVEFQLDSVGDGYMARFTHGAYLNYATPNAAPESYSFAKALPDFGGEKVFVTEGREGERVYLFLSGDKKTARIKSEAMNGAITGSLFSASAN